MMPNLSVLRQPVAILALLPSLAATGFADERTAAEILPPSVVVFAEIRQPQELLKTVYDHHLVRRLQELEPVRSALEKKPYLDFKAGVAIVESQMGLPWRRIVGQATGNGIALAIDAKTHGAAILARATDEGTQSKLVETLANLATQDAKTKDKPDPVKTTNYRGIKVYAVDKNKFTVAEGWLVATNNDELGKQIVDRILDKPQASLAGDAQFAGAHQAAPTSTTAWAYVNTEALRDAEFAKKLFSGQAENPLAELLFGGALSTLRQTSYVTVRAEVNDGQIRLSASAPHDRSWAGDSREYYFGPQGRGAAPPRLVADNAIASLCTYRDISAMWLRAGDLLNEQANEELAKADSGLSTLFSGKDFGEDILGALRPEVQIVVARQVYAEGQPAPAIKLPAFGWVAELKDPAMMQPELRRTFQNLIGFFNVVGAMNGQPQLELDLEKTDAAEFVTATHLADSAAKDPRSLKINYNFSPSIAFAGNRFVVATTKELAHILATANAAKERPGDEDRIVNTDAVLSFDVLRDILADNRTQLVAQNMLAEGHTKEEAEAAIGVLLELVSWFDHLALSLDTTATELQVTVDVDIKAAN
jgi:hypothetical protein